MSLLVDIMAGALDPAYGEAAARRARGEAPAGARLAARRAGLALAVVGAALLVTVAAVQHERSAPAAARTRTALLAAVRAQTNRTDVLTVQAAALRAGLTRLREAALLVSGAGRALSAQVTALEQASAATPLAGPGLQVTLDDAPQSAGQSGESRILDTDLQQVVNALWAAGARGVSVNGQRIGPQTSIRMAGEAILVDFRPVLAPYVVSAVGDPVRLETGFGASPTAARMRTLAQIYGLRFGYRRAARLGLAAAPPPALNHARPVGRGTA